MRHTAASLAISAGANVKAVQRMLGHASAAMTLDVYAGLFGDDLSAATQHPGGSAASGEAAARRELVSADTARLRDAVDLLIAEQPSTGPEMARLMQSRGHRMSDRFGLRWLRRAHHEIGQKPPLRAPS
ncbi:MAG: hypothetical protein ACRCY9_22395 [Phycicoccus sp.]